MSTNRNFQAMLNEFLPNPMLKEEFVKRDFVLSTVEKDDSWDGGNLVVAFKSAGSSSISSGGLTASNDIAQDKFVRGGISTYPEFWGAMLFNERDLIEHDKISEQNLLKMLPDMVDDFIEYFKSVCSVAMMNGAWFAKTTAASNSAAGVLVVDRIDRFVLDQKVIITATAPTPITGYVSTLDMNTLSVTLVTARGGATAVDFSANNVASGAKLYNDGFNTVSFTAMRDSLLSSTNGGSATLYGQTKTAAPYLQAINIDGSGVTAANIVEKCFLAFTRTRLFGKGKPTDIVMSLTNLGYVMMVVEASKGAFNVVPGSQKASQYGWTEIQIGSVTNQPLKFVGVQEMDEDIIMFLDWRGWKFYSNGFFSKRKDPQTGYEYHTIRAQTGYQYIVDIRLFGDLVLLRPSYQGIMFGVSIPTQIP